LLLPEKFDILSDYQLRVSAFSAGFVTDDNRFGQPEYRLRQATNSWSCPIVVAIVFVIYYIARYGICE